MYMYMIIISQFTKAISRILYNFIFNIIMASFLSTNYSVVHLHVHVHVHVHVYVRNSNTNFQNLSNFLLYSSSL